MMNKKWFLVIAFVFLAPRDWLRLEVQNSAGRPIMLSNPIYFIDNNTIPPVNRAP
jgi:hypothetical protein